MRSLLSILCFCLGAVVCVPAQEGGVFRLETRVEGSFSDFTVDKLGNLYLLNTNGQLKKLRANGDSLAVFNNVRQHGKIFSVDVSNPLKTLLYYKNFGTILILDRFLNVRSTLDLRKQNLLQVKTIGQSYDNNIWIFDELEMRIKKIADDGRLVEEFTDFRMIFDSVPAPLRIVDSENFLYLYDARMGVYIFDYFGTFKTRIPFTGWKDFNVIGNAILGRDERFLYRYNTGSLQLQEFAVPAFMNDAQKIVISTDHVYLLRDGTIMVYSYN